MRKRQYSQFCYFTPTVIIRRVRDFIKGRAKAFEQHGQAVVNYVEGSKTQRRNV